MDQEGRLPVVLLPRARFLPLLALAALYGCGPRATTSAADLTHGVWIGESGGDRFLFELRGASDSLSGVVHVMRQGKLESELPIAHATYRPPELRMSMPATGAAYAGHVDVAHGRIQGRLSYGQRQGPAMDLTWADPSALPGFRARAEAGPYSYREPDSGADDWPVATPEEAGLDRGALAALVNTIADGDAGLIHSIVVVRHDRLVLDEYFHGYGPADLHRLASATKSVASLLVGAAIDRSLIPGPDAALADFFPELADSLTPAWKEETLGDLLSMSMGLDWTANEAENVHGTGDAFFRHVFRRGVKDPPGTRWDYVNANVNLLAGVILHATGRHAEAFAADVLFAPLGIGTWNWDYGKVDGYALMDGSLQLRPRDMARIGALVADSGRWQGRQVVSARWIRESTRLRFHTGQPLGGYGYLWWLAELPTGQGGEPMVVANGWGSQFILVFPRLDMVVVTTGGNEDNGRHLDFGRVLAGSLPALVAGDEPAPVGPSTTRG
jgi:CubicO group peptidase (beta-lactamase class C family)